MNEANFNTGFVRSVRIDQQAIGSRDDYPFALPAVQQLQSVDFHKAVTFLVGENGSGKSTLLEALAVNLGFNAEGGTTNFNFSTEATHSPILMAYPDAVILDVEQGYKPIAYRDTAHYQTTRRFLEQPEKMMRYLLEES